MESSIQKQLQVQTFSLDSLVQVIILVHSLKKLEKENRELKAKVINRTKVINGLKQREIYFCLEATSLFVPETFKFKVLKRDF